MNIKKHIPNLITLSNLLCGTIAVIYATQKQFELTALFVVLGIVFDFFDGFVARILKVSGELGKQLDSLADMVTSGVVPGLVVFFMIQETVSNQEKYGDFIFSYIPYIGLLLTLGACYRLANFNIDTRQSDSFIGLPTPAMSLFVVALPLIPIYSDNQFIIDLVQNSYFLISVAIGLSYLMNAEIPLFSLKFKTFGIKANLLKYMFLIVSFVFLISLGVIAIPTIIIWYVLLSIISNTTKKKIK